MTTDLDGLNRLVARVSGQSAWSGVLRYIVECVPWQRGALHPQTHSCHLAQHSSLALPPIAPSKSTQTNLGVLGLLGRTPKMS